MPCGCRGRVLAASLRADGFAVRGTTRGDHVEEIRACGAEPYIGDPDRIATLMEALHGVAIVVWLAGSVEIPEGRLRMFWEKLVDTGVRGVVHEGPYEELSRRSSSTWQIPLEIVTGVDEARAAVARLLGV